MQQQPEAVMVCVTRQRACRRLIAHGQDVARRTRLDLIVVHVARPGENLLGNPSEGEALDFLFTTAKDYGGQMQMLRSDHVVSALQRFALENHVATIVMGASRGDNTLIAELTRALEEHAPTVRIDVVDSQE